MLLAEIPEFKTYTNVFSFVRDHLSMQFGDIRSMMRLPLPALGVDHACNFAAVATLCNLISGISVSQFIPVNPSTTDKKAKKHWIGTGDAFKALLEEFYPWLPGEIGKDRAKVLYDLFRNPFAHALGVHGKTHYKIKITRMILKDGGGNVTGLEDGQLQVIESSPNRPAWLPLGLSGSGTQWDLVVEGFYRDVFHMLWSLARDRGQMTKAEERFSKGTIIWRQGKP
jgi:hypothetical protein